jgi:hypothetical protein
VLHFDEGGICTSGTIAGGHRIPFRQVYIDSERTHVSTGHSLTFAHR